VVVPGRQGGSGDCGVGNDGRGGYWEGAAGAGRRSLEIHDVIDDGGRLRGGKAARPGYAGNA